MKSRVILFLLMLSAFMFALETGASAAAKQWTTVSPLPLLPFVFLFAAAAECFAVWFFGRTHKLAKTAVVVGILNLVPFLAPHIIAMFGDAGNGIVYSLFHVFEKRESYLISMESALFMTVIECPAVYLLLKKYVEDKLRLIIVIAAANIASSAVAAVVERLICKGTW